MNEIKKTVHKLIKTNPDCFKSTMGDHFGKDNFAAAYKVVKKENKLLLEIGGVEKLNDLVKTAVPTIPNDMLEDFVDMITTYFVVTHMKL